jgi:hypothetical protein
MPIKGDPVPCRLSVLLAREAPVGVIFRRGPSKQVELIKWKPDVDGQLTSQELADFNSDTFEARRAPAWAQKW